MNLFLGKASPFLPLVCAAALLATNSVCAAKDAAFARVPLEATGVEQDAEGEMRASLGSKKSVVSVELEGLTANQDYSLKVGTLTEAEFKADKKGRARLRFYTPAKRGKALLDFDPRGETLAILNGTGESVLEAVISGENEPSGSVVNERAELTRQEGAMGSAKASFDVQKNGKRAFRVQLSGISGSGWRLFVNGIERGVVELRGKKGEALFSSGFSIDEKQPLDFDPRGAVIDIFQDGTLRFSGRLEAKAKGVNFATRNIRTASIPSTGIDADAFARAKLRTNADATRDFSVELEDVPAGNYTLVINGAVKGTIIVVATENGTNGEIEFTNDIEDDSSSELPLDFEPLGATVAILGPDTAVKYFEGIFNPSATKPGGGSSEPPGVLEETLASTGLAPDASGDAEYEIEARGKRKFSVEIEDVEIGKYQLLVGGVLRGQIQAQLTEGEVRGEIEFSTGDDDDDESPLRFDPRGQLIEVRSTAGTLFSHLFGDGSASGGTTVPLEIEIPLINQGISPQATARAEFKRDDDGDLSFEVEAEDLPAGAYDLLVDGTVRATLTVITGPNGTRGQIEFESEGDDGALPLTFDVLGKSIVLQSGSTVYFSREFPTGS